VLFDALFYVLFDALSYSTVTHVVGAVLREVENSNRDAVLMGRTPSHRALSNTIWEFGLSQPSRAEAHPEFARPVLVSV